MTASGESESLSLPPGFKRKLARHLAVEIGPLAIFFLGFLWQGLLWATAFYAVATALAFAATWASHRRLPVLPTITALLVLIFAGLTLALDEAMFIKIKPTVVNGFYGLALLIGWLAGFRLVEKVLSPHVALDETGLRRLTFRASAYLLALAAINELVWRTVPTEEWVIFKVFVIVAGNLAFAASQLPLVRRHLRRTDERGGALPAGGASP